MSEMWQNNPYSPITFDERVTFWLQRTRPQPCASVFAALYACVIAYWLQCSIRTRTRQWLDALKPKSYSLLGDNQTIGAEVLMSQICKPEGEWIRQASKWHARCIILSHFVSTKWIGCYCREPVVDVYHFTGHGKKRKKNQFIFDIK